MKISKKLLLFVVVMMSFVACYKENSTDITNISWRVEYIYSENQKLTVKNKDYYNKDAYILIFKNDSIFQLNTSVNLTIGNFEILQKNSINIFHYQEITEIGGQNIIDKKLLQYLPKIFSYKVMNDELILIGNNCKIKLKKTQKGD